MKNNIILFIITLLAITGCSEQPQTTKNAGEKDSFNIVYNGEGDTDSNSTEELMWLEESDELPEGRIDISKLFLNEELDKIRDNFISQLRFNFSFYLGDEMALLSDDKELEDEDFINHEISDEEKSENMDVIYHILLKKNPGFKSVPKDLFEKKMKSVFNIDINDVNNRNALFYTNFAMHSLSAATSCYAVYIDLKNRIISLGNLPFSFEEEMDWDEFNNKNLAQESIEYFDTKVKLYKEYLNEASQKKYTIYCSKKMMEYLFHVNNYVFYDSQASLSWLLTNTDDVPDFASILYDFFNYDKEPRINKVKFQFDISKGFPLETNAYKGLFGEVESCVQTQYYNYFKFKVRTGMMQYVVDNCYDETDLDQYGIKNDKNICVMEDCFDYLFGYVLKGDEYKESEACHYYQVCAYLAYYLQKAYDKYVSYGKGDPRCWHNALVANLRSDIENNDSRFEKYVKANDYFHLEGFEQIMQEAHKLALER